MSSKNKGLQQKKKAQNCNSIFQKQHFNKVNDVEECDIEILSKNKEVLMVAKAKLSYEKYIKV